MKKPIQIEDGEWWFKGCFIQTQNHPSLSKYAVFADTELQEHIGVASNMKDAITLCKENEVVDYKFGYQSFINVIQK